MSINLPFEEKAFYLRLKISEERKIELIQLYRIYDFCFSRNTKLKYQDGEKYVIIKQRMKILNT